MNSTFADTADVSRGSAVPPAAKPLGVTLVTLVRREFWEHRYLWIAPLAVELVLIVFGAIAGHGHVRLPGQADFDAWPHPQAQKVAAFTILQWMLSVPAVVVLGIVVSWYALDSLYAERKDRSILFWKSMPVSDTLTVLSKALVALVVAPLVVFVLAQAGQLVFSAIIGLRMAFGGVPAVLSFDLLEWFRTELVMLVMLVVAMFWYAPIVAAMLLLSVWARPNPFLWAFLAPILAPILERIAFGTHYLSTFIKYRAFGIWGTLAHGPTHGHLDIISRHGLRPVGSLLDEFSIGSAFADIDLWLGVAVAAALLFAAIRIRRYHDET
jgi:ABC-2 type transport system permease protein